jgi:hypothetical protein
MGTSISHRSPLTSNWKAASAAYIYPDIKISRAVEEIWRAASNQPVGNLGVDLSTPIVAQCLQIAIQAPNPEEASRKTSMVIALSGEASLAADLAARVAVRTARETRNRVAAFAYTLFSEAADYLVSRDLPGYVGVGERLKNVSDSIEFKSNIRRQVEKIVCEIPIPKGIEKESRIWKSYVDDVVFSLKGRK